MTLILYSAGKWADSEVQRKAALRAWPSPASKCWQLLPSLSNGEGAGWKGFCLFEVPSKSLIMVDLHVIIDGIPPEQSDYNGVNDGGNEKCMFELEYVGGGEFSLLGPKQAHSKTQHAVDDQVPAAF